jgi:hypothetical protein
MHIYIVVVAWACIALLVLGVIRRISQISQWRRGELWIAILVLGLSTFGLDYSYVEFIRNKGPDDWGAMSYAMHTVRGKYRSLESPKIDMSDYDYVKDAAQPLSGVYRFHYQCAGQKGTVTCHYDKSTRKFDSGQVVPDN